MSDKIRNISEAKARIYQLAMKEARQREDDAGHSGAHNDGGAQRLRDIAEAWLAGLQGKIPKTLESFKVLARDSYDPEWGEYVRLRTKFGRR